MDTLFEKSIFKLLFYWSHNNIHYVVLWQGTTHPPLFVYRKLWGHTLGGFDSFWVRMTHHTQSQPLHLLLVKECGIFKKKYHSGYSMYGINVKTLAYDWFIDNMTELIKSNGLMIDNHWVEMYIKIWYRMHLIHYIFKQNTHDTLLYEQKIYQHAHW